MVFLGYEYLHKNAFKSPSQVVKEFAEFNNHGLAFSLNEKEKRHKHAASFETPSILIVSYFSKKEAI